LQVGSVGADFRIADQFGGFQRLEAFGSGETESLAGRIVDVLCAIGRPSGFVTSLKSLGLDLGKIVTLPDHSSFDTVRWDLFDHPVVVTAKDAVKLQDDAKALAHKVYVARHAVTIEPAEAFRAKLKELIER
jgi:tetraacyldisaccharide-1-P 4'-kinase